MTMRTEFGLLIAFGMLTACGGTPDDTEWQQTESDARSVAEPPALEVIASGANLSGSNGLHFGPDGLLYVASVVGSDLTVIDPETGAEVRRFTVEDGVIGPDDVAFASDGSFYWTSILTGEVAGFTPEGKKIVAAQLPPGANPITFSNDDRLFVSQCFLGTNLYELDPSGETPPRLIADDLGPGCGLNGMDWGPDNRLYGPRWFAGEVVSFDVDTGERRTEATGFRTPAAIKFDSRGTLHVLDTGTGELIRVEDGEKQTIATLDRGLDNFAFDSNDIPFVSSFTDGFVKRVNQDGTITTLQPGGLVHPGGVAVLGDVVWVADGRALRGFDRHTGEMRVTQRSVVGVDELGGAINLSVAGETLILTSWFDGGTRIWDPVAEELLAHYPDQAAPTAAVAYAGGVAVAEHVKGAVTLYGNGEPVPLATGLSAPTGLFVAEDALYVGDRDAGQILLVARSGTALPQPEIVLRDLDAPEGFLVTEDGFVVVEADSGRVVHVDQAGNRRVLATAPAGSPSTPGLPPSQIFNGIAVDEDGNLFITGETSRALYRINSPW